MYIACGFEIRNQSTVKENDHIRCNSRPCPYKCPPIIFWSYKPQSNQPSTRSVHETNILSSIWLEISLKMAKSHKIFGSILASNIETKSAHLKWLISALSAYWNEYGNNNNNNNSNVWNLNFKKNPEISDSSNTKCLLHSQWERHLGSWVVA